MPRTRGLENSFKKNIERRGVRFNLKPLISLPNSYLKEIIVPLNASSIAVFAKAGAGATRTRRTIPPYNGTGSSAKPAQYGFQNPLSRCHARAPQPAQRLISKNSSLPRNFKTRFNLVANAPSLKIKDQNIKKIVSRIRLTINAEAREGQSKLTNNKSTAGLPYAQTANPALEKSRHPAGLAEPEIFNDDSSNKQGKKVNLLYLLRLISEKGPLFVKKYHRNVVKKNKFLTTSRDVLTVNSLNSRYLNLVDPVLNKT